MTQRLRFNTAQAAEYAICHEQTVLKAAAAGELHGAQRKKGGRWTFRLECLEAWVQGDVCEHADQQPATDSVVAERRIGSAS